jgi:response regulator of citrate/malate metabolism
VDAMRLGAHDLILKPLQLKKVSLVLKDMAEKVFSLRREQVAGDGQTDKMGLVSPLPVPCTDLEELERLTVRRVFEFVDGGKGTETAGDFAGDPLPQDQAVWYRDPAK